MDGNARSACRIPNGDVIRGALRDGDGCRDLSPRQASDERGAAAGNGDEGSGRKRPRPGLWARSAACTKPLPAAPPPPVLAPPSPSPAATASPCNGPSCDSRRRPSGRAAKIIISCHAPTHATHAPRQQPTLACLPPRLCSSSPLLPSPKQGNAIIKSRQPRQHNQDSTRPAPNKSGLVGEILDFRSGPEVGGDHWWALLMERPPPGYWRRVRHADGMGRSISMTVSANLVNSL